MKDKNDQIDEKAREIREYLKKTYPYSMRADIEKSELDEMINMFALMKALKDVTKAVTRDDCIKTATKKTSKLMWNAVAAKPSDIIYLTPEIVKNLGKLWGHDDVLNEHDLGIPTDLLISGTIPITNLRIGSKLQSHDDIETKDATVVIKPTYKHDIAELREGKCDYAVVGYLHIRFETINCEIVTELIMARSHIGELCMNPNVAVKGSVEPACISRTGFEYLCVTYLLVWYTVQIALLHPLTKECIISTNEPPIGCRTTNNDSASNSHKNNPHKVKNVRHRYVDMNTLEMLVKKPKSNGNNGERKYTRRTMVWHVAGYMRGNKFIDGHWRGPWRHMKDLAETVEREIATATTEEDET